MSYINILNFSITGDCTNSGLGEIYLEITGDSPTWVVSEDPIVTGYLPTSGLTSGNNIYYVQGLSAGTYTLKIQDTVITPGDGYYIFLPLIYLKKLLKILVCFIKFLLTNGISTKYIKQY